MPYLIAVNTNHDVVDLFHSEVSVDIPADAVQITDTEAENILAHPRGAAVFALINGAVVLDDNREQRLALDEAMEAKREEVRAAFALASVEPVTMFNIAWHGGYESATKLDAAYRLAERRGVLPMFSDIDNAMHTLSLVDADAIVLAIASKYQDDFAHKQQLMNAVDAAVTVAEVNAITWL